MATQKISTPRLEGRKKTTMRRTALLLVFAAAALQGCGSSDLLTDPGLPGNAGPAVTGDAIGVVDGAWRSVASTKVNPGHDPFTLSGSRYSVAFSRNALDRATTIVIYERDPQAVDVRLDPDGTTFTSPVSLTVDYSGTVNDPDSPFFNGRAPRVGRFEVSTGTWTLLAGVDSPSTKTYTVALTGFSRYAMVDGSMVPNGEEDGSKATRTNEASAN
jgi:hypothetical protein